MSNLNYTDCEEEDLRKQYPSWKMMNSLVQSRKLWSVDGKHYFLLMNTYDGQEVASCVCLDVIGNTYLPKEIVEKYTVHVSWVCTRNEWRNCGMLSVVMQYLIEAAEENGVFLHLHARPFDIELPKLANPDDVEKWTDENYGTHNPSLKRDKENSKIMKRKYLGMGFCRYDGAGLRFQNRYWRKMCCGYRSSRIENPLLSKFLDSHLYC